MDAFQPYDTLRAEQTQVRLDTVDVVLGGLAAGGESIVLVNNRLEGNSPATIDALVRMLVGRLAEVGG